MLQKGPSILRPPSLGPPFGNLKDFSLRLIEELRTFPPLGREGRFRDAIGRRDELAKGGSLPDDFRVSLNIADARRALCELREIGHIEAPGGAAQVFQSPPHG